MPIEAVAVAASGLMPTRQLDKAEMRDAVQQAIASLGERQRMAVLLSKFEHFSYAEIGEVMDMSPRGGEVAAVAGTDATARSAGTVFRTRHAACATTTATADTRLPTS